MIDDESENQKGGGRTGREESPEGTDAEEPAETKRPLHPGDELRDELVEGLRRVREDGRSNMLDISGVASVAVLIGETTLASWLADHEHALMQNGAPYMNLLSEM